MHKEAIKKILDYMEENLENDIDLDKIAREAGYSKYHLNRLFTEETGCTIHKYLRSRRLSVAAQKLVKTDIPISQIAYEAGYSSQQAFTLAFREIYLCTPRKYRKSGILKPMQNRITMIYQFETYRTSIKKTEAKAA